MHLRVCVALGISASFESSCRLPSGWECQHWEPCQGNGQGSARRPGTTMPPRANAVAGTLGRYKQGGECSTRGFSEGRRCSGAGFALQVSHSAGEHEARAFAGQ
jgi:hypothetical protein